MFRKFQRMLEADTGAGVNGSGNTGNTDTTTQNESTSNEKTETNQSEKTFTQKDVDKLIQERVAREQAKWEKKVQDERTEAEKLAKMNADQKAEYEKQKREDELAKREKDITTRELRATAYETLAEKNLPKELVDILNYESAETCNKSIEAVEKAFQSAVEKAVNDKLRGGNPPKGGQGSSNQSTFGFNFTGVRPKETK
jgi:flagellar biosynthesis GTPase FlhF|nr:MAG TPA: capsid scaffolding protein [Caudoviricetes sp.]